ncbi:MAG: alpha/beta hydrolase [Actinomycetota bacterium]|nr:alpha/beta hydrolase [Actinomycetota bacterium]MDD5667995.1 alpha/beta hydrolase [Actinomycetota bacterium]
MRSDGNELSVGGFRIFFERKGKGPPLVLLHGALGDSRDWRRQLDGLCDDFDVVAWDAPGCGRSSDPPETYRLSDFADTLVAFIREIGLERPHVLGLSFGSSLVLEFYRRYPEIPKKLVLASAYAGWAGSLPPEVVAARLEVALADAERPPEQVVEAWMPSMFPETAPAELIAETAAIMSDFHPAGMRAMARSLAEADLRSVLPLIAVPTLLLYGELDERSPLHVARELNSLIPASRLVVIPGVGHLANVEAPETFNSSVRDFLLTP